MVLCHMEGLGVHGRKKRQRKEDKNLYTPTVRIQATVYTVQAHLSASLFSSVHSVEHIVSSLKMPRTKLFFCLCVCMCGSAMIYERANQSSTLRTDFVIQTQRHSGY